MTPRSTNLLFTLLSLAAVTPLVAAPAQPPGGFFFENVQQPPIGGPYLNDLDAAMHGVHLGENYLNHHPDNVTNTTVAPVRTIAVWGDNQAEIISSYRYSAFLPSTSVTPGVPHSPVEYSLLPGVPHPERYSVVQHNPGGTGPLSVSLDGTLLTVTLGRQDSVPVSTLQEIRAAVAQACGGTFAVISETHLSGIAAAHEEPVFAAPASSYDARSPFTWLQTLTGQAFQFAQRTTGSGDVVPGAPHFGKSGDWDFGDDQATALDLAANPGPAGAILASRADLIVGNAGSFDLIQGFTPEQTCDHITALWTTLQDAGRTFAWMAIPPFGDAAMREKVDQTNQLLIAAGEAKRVVVLRWDYHLADANDTGTAFLDGGPVPSSDTAYRQAVSMLPLFKPLVAAAPRYDMTPASWITANPTLDLSKRTAAPSGWLTDGSPRLHLDNGTPPSTGPVLIWKQIRVDPPASGTADPGVTLSTVPSTRNWAEGDLVEGVARIIMVGGTQFQDLSLQVHFHGTDGILSTMVAGAAPTAFLDGLPNYINQDIVLRTPACAVPHGTTGISLSVTTRGGATYFLRNAGVRRAVPAPESVTAIPVSLPGDPALTLAPLYGGTVTTHYTGSIYAYAAGSDVPTGRARGGFDSFTLAKDGAFSARGRIDGVVFSVKGKLDLGGSGTVTVQLPASLTGGAPASLTLYHVISTADGTSRLTGAITGINGDRPLAIDLVQTGAPAPATPYPAGLYTAIIPAPAAEASFTGTPTPRGAGVATFTVKPDGSLRCQYVLADGTLGTRSGKLGGDSIWQFYFPAGGSAAAKGGLLAGHLQFHHSIALEDLSSDLDGDLSWKVPANPKAALFPAGFDTQARILGWKYTPATRNAYALPGLAGFTGNNAVLSIAENPGVPAAWSVTDTIKAPGLNARLNRATGLITGTYTDPATRTKYSLYNVLLQNQDSPTGGFAKSPAAVLPATLDPASGN